MKCGNNSVDNSLCGNPCSGLCVTAHTPIVDLTPETFSRYRNLANVTCFPCTAKVILSIGNCS